MYWLRDSEGLIVLFAVYISYLSWPSTDGHIIILLFCDSKLNQSCTVYMYASGHSRHYIELNWVRDSEVLRHYIELKIGYETVSIYSSMYNWKLVTRGFTPECEFLLLGLEISCWEGWRTFLHLWCRRCFCSLPRLWFLTLLLYMLHTKKISCKDIFIKTENALTSEILPQVLPQCAPLKAAHLVR